jgi:cytochrome d ubiquinol oxidase subunit II
LPIVSAVKYGEKGIWFSGFGTVLAVFSIFLLAGFNNTSYYPSVADLQSSLTIANSSSSHYTLTAMSYVSLIIPFVLIYIVYVWRIINRKKVDISDLDSEHVY